jgi:hypothetical protein
MRIGEIQHQPIFDSKIVYLQAAKPDATDTESTITSGEETSIFGTLTDFLFKMWEWVKEYILCLCIEDRAEQITVLSKELRGFTSLFRRVGVPPASVQEKFSALSLQAQLAIAAEIEPTLEFGDILSERGEKALALLRACTGDGVIQDAIADLDEHSRNQLDEAYATTLSGFSDTLGTAKKILDGTPDGEAILTPVKLLVLRDVVAQKPLWEVEKTRALVNWAWNAIKTLKNNL